MMKKISLIVSALLGFSSSSFADLNYQEIQVFVDEIAQGAGDDAFYAEYDLAGLELVNGVPSGSWDNTLFANAFDETRSVSAMITECLAVEVEDKLLAKEDWVYTVVGPCESAVISRGYLAGGDALPLQWYGYISNRYYSQPTANASLVTIKAQFSTAASGEGILAFNSTDKSLNVELPETNWADIHYSINGGAQLNYRMTKDGDGYKQVIFQALENGDEIQYYTTSQDHAGVIIESQSKFVTVDGLVDPLSPHYANGEITLDSIEALDWVDVHYSINGSSPYNYRMNGTGLSFTFSTPQQLLTGDVISFSFTYSLNGIASNTVEYIASQ